MPFWAGYEASPDSAVADMNNVSDGPFAGSVTAALFLRRFVRQARRFAHFDIYGWRQAAKPLGPKGAEVQTAQQVMEEMRRRKPVAEDPHNILLRGAHNVTFATYLHMLASPAQTIMNGIETYMQGIPRIGATFGLGRATTAMARVSASTSLNGTGMIKSAKASGIPGDSRYGCTRFWPKAEAGGWPPM